MKMSRHGTRPEDRSLGGGNGNDERGSIGVVSRDVTLVAVLLGISPSRRWFTYSRYCEP